MPETPVERALLSLDQLEAAIVRYADALEEALEAGDDRKAPLLEQISGLLEERKAEVIDGIVRGLLALEDHISLAEHELERFEAARDKLREARTKIRLHLVNWIDENMPANEPKLQGNLFWLRTQANGGLPALRIRDENEIPRDYFVITPRLVLPATVTAEQVEGIQAYLDAMIPGARLEPTEKPVLDEDRLRMTLTAEIHVDGVSLERGRHLRYNDPRKTKAKGKALPAPPQGSPQTIDHSGT